MRPLGFSLLVTLAALGPAQGCSKDASDCAKLATCGEFRPRNGAGGGGAGTANGTGGGGAAACDAPCEGDTPICDDESGECVACTEADGCDSGLCDPASHTCVACLENEDCEDAGAPRCDGGECVGCTEADDCAGIAGKPLCHVESGACVECLPGEHDTCGTGFLCHGQLRECVEAQAGSAASCQPCVADAHCQPGRHCVAPGRFGEEGYFCLPEPNPGCAARRPFVFEMEEVATIDDATVTVCGHAFTSCAGLNDFRSAVPGCSEAGDATIPGEPGPGDEVCGLEGTTDGTRCRAFSGEARCTYRCSSNDDCLCGHDCTGDQVCSFDPNAETCD